MTGVYGRCVFPPGKVGWIYNGWGSSYSIEQASVHEAAPAVKVHPALSLAGMRNFRRGGWG